MSNDVELNSVQIAMLQYLRDSSKEHPMDLRKKFNLGKGGNIVHHRNYLEICEHGKLHGSEMNHLAFVATNKDGLCWITEKGKEALNKLFSKPQEDLELI